MKTSIVCFIALVSFFSCTSQNRVLDSQTNQANSESTQQIALETIIASACNKNAIESNVDDFCASNLENLKEVNEILIDIKRPPLPKPCDSQGNCKINFREATLLKSYSIEKITNVYIQDRKGTITNRASIELQPTDNFKYAQVLHFSKPIGQEGDLIIKGYSENSGNFSAEINLKNLQK